MTRHVRPGLIPEGCLRRHRLTTALRSKVEDERVLAEVSVALTALEMPAPSQPPRTRAIRQKPAFPSQQRKGLTFVRLRRKNRHRRLDWARVLIVHVEAIPLPRTGWAAMARGTAHPSKADCTS